MSPDTGRPETVDEAINFDPSNRVYVANTTTGRALSSEGGIYAGAQHHRSGSHKRHSVSEKEVGDIEDDERDVKKAQVRNTALVEPPLRANTSLEIPRQIPLMACS